MNKFNIKSVYRSAGKNKVLSFAKLFSISISFAIVLFAAAYVYFELSYDEYIPDHDKIFRCFMNGKLNNEEVDLAVTAPPMAQKLIDEIPEIKEALRLVSEGEATIIYKDQQLPAAKLLYADTCFFSFFGIHVEKELQNSLESDNNIVISRSLAAKYFGSPGDALNQVVELNSEECLITGIFDDFPKNSHLQFDIIQSVEKTNPGEKGWDYQSYITYVKTNSEIADIDNLSFKITKTVYTHSHDYIDGSKAQTWEDLKSSDERYLAYRVEPLKDIHFSSHKFDLAVTSSKTYVYGTVILTIIILFISLLNFVNLSIADLSSRLKEIGVYKTAGADNKQIIYWFIFESLIYWCVGFIFALLIYKVTGKYLAQYLNLKFFIGTELFLKITGFLFSVLIFFNLIANIPQILFIRKRKVLGLLNDGNHNKMAFSSKKGLVFFQFILSALIIQGTFLVQKQINFFINTNRGYETDNVMMFSLGNMGDTQRESFINQLKSNSSIKTVATSWAYLGTELGQSTAFFESLEDENSVQSSVITVDAEFQEVFKFNLREGRFFDSEKRTDFNSVILNEAAAKKYQKAGSLVGKNLYLYANEKPFQIIGIANDFNFRSLHHKIEPLVIKYAENCNKVFVKLDYAQISTAIKEIQKQWEEFNIQEPFEYRFHNEILAKHYEKEQQAKRILFVLSIISIVITCIGLYAISHFTIKKKIKEIGIRKVNGAKASEILVLLNKDFLKWVTIAFIVATPVTFFIINKWLENFAYKTILNWWIFALAGFLIVGIALLTVSFQSWKAATRNPVEALRYE